MLKWEGGEVSRGMTIRLAACVAAIAVSAAISGVAEAKPTSQAHELGRSLVVKIKDSRGKALPYATVAIRALNRGSLSDEKGVATIDSLAVGTYEVIIVAAGYDRKVVRARVGAARTTRLTVRVTGSPPLDSNGRAIVPSFRHVGPGRDSSAGGSTVR